MKDDDKHLVFMGIRVFDAAVSNFEVPKGSVQRACAVCAEMTWVQASSIKIINTPPKPKSSILCYRCARKLPLDKVRKEDVHMVPEAIPELLEMLKTRRQ